MKDMGYFLDNELSDREHKVFCNPTAIKAITAYRGTDMRDPTSTWSDLKSDLLNLSANNQETLVVLLV